MSTEKTLKEDNAYTVPGKLAIDKADDTSFIKSVKEFFKKQKDAELSRIESTAKGSELFDIDVTLKLSEDDAKKQAQATRQIGSAAVHQLKQDFYTYLNKEGFKIQTMSVRGVRQNGDTIETTISCVLANVPKMHREHTERRKNLIESLLTEAAKETEKEIETKK